MNLHEPTVDGGMLVRVLTRGEDVCSQRPVAALVRGHDPRHLGRNVRVVVPAAGPSVFHVEDAAALSVALGKCIAVQ